jgi:hypothetical protein
MGAPCGWALNSAGLDKGTAARIRYGRADLCTDVRLDVPALRCALPHRLDLHRKAAGYGRVAPNVSARARRACVGEGAWVRM